jgi:hypothetical protein
MDWRQARRRGFPDASMDRRLAEHPHHDTAIIARPDGSIGRERIGPVALVAVDRRRVNAAAACACANSPPR